MIHGGQNNSVAKDCLYSDIKDDRCKLELNSDTELALIDLTVFPKTLLFGWLMMINKLDSFIRW